jgi:hypothetical protein
MSEMFQFYGDHREAFRVAAVGGAFICMQLVILLWTLRRLAELSNIRERMSRLADGLALLTDTTEAGMATLAAQLDQINRKPKTARPASRATVAKRVTEAARKGDQLPAIAADEALSESEVRLHLALSNGRVLSPDSPLAS